MLGVKATKKALVAGDLLMVTQSSEFGKAYGLKNAGSRVAPYVFASLFRANLTPVKDGLFDDCSQTFAWKESPPKPPRKRKAKAT